MNSVAYQLVPREGPDGLRQVSRPVPRPGPTQVVVRVRAASFNRRDLMLMDGSYPLPATPGVVPLSDGVGEVVAVGDGVTRVAVGDRVTATYYLHWLRGPQRLAHVREQYGANHDGWLAEHIVLEQDSAVAVPDHLTDAEAASLSCAGVVAWKTLADPAPVLPGESVLTVGTGSVALFAVRFARLRGARVLSITSSAEKAGRLRELGADEVIDRTEFPDWEQTVLERTGGAGVDHVVEAVGRPTLAKSVAASAFNARVTVIGVFPADGAAGDPFGGGYLSIRRIAVGSRADFEDMNRAIAAHRLRPVVGRVFRFEDAAEAYRYFRDGDPFGKVVIERG
ncbi:zinc-dependent alcohol dehydrogenase family protein [Nocardia aurantia]|uniref:Alcohol dehydrogenase n=1 Tax=Nocardia aurantia TaxID=2585199 RepID=A0A7K0E3H7_9NOCA|nr:NAD(P)-dependent alcohol dehydrogenase [Nocardia aurantia]MQY31704.1 alcohol dehydrogenase [Nocardia aurantia]